MIIKACSEQVVAGSSVCVFESLGRQLLLVPQEYKWVFQARDCWCEKLATRAHFHRDASKVCLLLSRNEQDTSHKLNMRHDRRAGNLTLVSIKLTYFRHWAMWATCQD